MEVTVTRYGFVDIFCTQLYPDHLKNAENINRISFHPLSDFWLAMYWFPQNSHLLNSKMWRSSISKFTKINQKMWKVDSEFIYAIR
jgi:hypothetical protein